MMTRSVFVHVVATALLAVTLIMVGVKAGQEQQKQHNKYETCMDAVAAAELAVELCEPLTP